MDGRPRPRRKRRKFCLTAHHFWHQLAIAHGQRLQETFQKSMGLVSDIREVSLHVTVRETKCNWPVDCSLKRGEEKLTRRREILGAVPLCLHARGKPPPCTAFLHLCLHRGTLQRCLTGPPPQSWKSGRFPNRRRPQRQHICDGTLNSDQLAVPRHRQSQAA